MIDIIFSSIQTALTEAVEDNTHPFRYFTLATSDTTGVPYTRTVVLRNIDNHLTITICTDRRSKKTTHISQQKNVSLLFFDLIKSIQLTIQARAYIVKDDTILQNMWNQIPKHSRKEYMTKLAPGKKIRDTENIDFLEEKHFFSIIKIIPTSLDYLQLDRSGHTRVLFEKEDQNWKSSYLVP